MINDSSKITIMKRQQSNLMVGVLTARGPVVKGSRHQEGWYISSCVRVLTQAGTVQGKWLKRKALPHPQRMMDMAEKDTHIQGTDAIEYTGLNQRITRAHQGRGRWWRTPLSPAVRRQRQKVSEFQAGLDSIMASAGTGPAELSRNTVNAHLFMHSLQRLPGCHTRAHTRTRICELLLLGRENCSAAQAGCTKSPTTN